MTFSAYVARLFGRRYDRKIDRPTGVTAWLNDKPDAINSLTLALQHLSVQSVYFIISAAAASIATDPAQIIRFLCLSILAVAIWQGLQVLNVGPFGSGYPIPSVQSRAMTSAYLLVGNANIGFHGLAALIVVTGLFAIILTFSLTRIRLILPNEILGVVVFLVGVATIGLAAKLLGLTAVHKPIDENALIVLFFCLSVISIIALSRTKAAKFAVLLDSLLSIGPALWLGEGDPNAGSLLAHSPWLAFPEPWLTNFSHIPLGTWSLFLLVVLTLKRTYSVACLRYSVPPMSVGLGPIRYHFAGVCWQTG
ncbi:MAG TPA: hypothetical protein PLD79_07555 [Halothiobacillus sp.]|nr:hypothetical protein [Halothiobacillus sp.]